MLSLEQRLGVMVARLEGEIDLANAGRLEEALKQAVGESVEGLVVDLSSVTYLDSTGVRLLFELAGWLETSGRRVRAVVPDSAHVRKVLSIASFPERLALDGSLEDAVGSLA